ncbi:MAG: SH3 domain-containing protein [Anaerolineales bacterium]|nr:SH3 domain-containing protein [Anaerolineales bacterium]
MMRLQPLNYYLTLLCLTLFLAACNPSVPTTEPDLIATEVAVQKTAAAILTAEAAPTQAASEPTSTPVPDEPNSTPDPVTDTSAPTPGSENAPSPTPTFTPETAASPACTVVASSLNLRSGPGVAYTPITTIGQGVELVPIGFSAIGYPGGQWVQVQTPDNQTGWVSTDVQFVSCNVDFVALPPVSVPPPPTATPTATLVPVQPTPTPSPTPESFVVFEPPGGGNDNIDGYVVFPGYAQGQLDFDDLVFRDRLVFRVVAFDKEVGQSDGAGIDNVHFEIRNDAGIVHERTERTPGYCVFGGGEPICEVWVFDQHNYRWPAPHNDKVIENGSYSVKIIFNPKESEPANWRFNFRIEGSPAKNQPSNLSAQIVQTAPNSDADVVYDALIFQVFASADGVNDGEGIDRVDMRIIGPNGEVYQRTEQSAAYCAFSGGEPDCNAWNFAANNYQWPNGDPIEFGSEYLLQAIVHAEDGSSTTVEMDIQILQ